jgi:hypothetical protein
VEVILDVRPDDKAKPFKLTPIKVDLTNAIEQTMGVHQFYAVHWGQNGSGAA